MAPPKMDVPSHVAKKTHIKVTEPQEINEGVPKTTQRGEFIDIDAIPSTHEEPTSLTLVEEEAQDPTTTSMDIDL
jgi:hypothetical protein